MAEGARGVDGFARRLGRMCGKRFWNVWRGHGSHLFFETGTPQVEFSTRTHRRREVGGRTVESRSARVHGECGFVISMAEWTVVYEGRLLAHSESSDRVFSELTRWLTGQALTEVVPTGTLSLRLGFDLGAVVSLCGYGNEGFEVVDLRDDEGVLALLDNGEFR